MMEYAINNLLINGQFISEPEIFESKNENKNSAVTALILIKMSSESIEKASIPDHQNYYNILGQ